MCVCVCVCVVGRGWGANLMYGQVRDVWFLFQQVQVNQIGCHGFNGKGEFSCVGHQCC